MHSFVPANKMESTENALGIKVNVHVITNEQVIADHLMSSL